MPELDGWVLLESEGEVGEPAGGVVVGVVLLSRVVPPTGTLEYDEGRTLGSMSVAPSVRPGVGRGVVVGSMRVTPPECGLEDAEARVLGSTSVAPSVRPGVGEGVVVGCMRVTSPEGMFEGRVLGSMSVTSSVRPGVGNGVVVGSVSVEPAPHRVDGTNTVPSMVTAVMLSLVAGVGKMSMIGVASLGVTTPGVVVVDEGPRRTVSAAIPASRGVALAADEEALEAAVF